MEQLINAAQSQMAGAAAEQTGVSQDLAAKALPMAMAVLMNGLKSNTKDANGAEALSAALDKHDGALLDNPNALNADSVMADGERILGHILGGKRGQVEEQLAAATGGVDKSQMSAILAMAAPAVLAALGKEKRQRGLGAQDIAGLVRSEDASARAAAPAELSGLAGLLDADGDGNLNNEAIGLGKRLLGGLFGRK